MLFLAIHTALFCKIYGLPSNNFFKLRRRYLRVTPILLSTLNSVYRHKGSHSSAPAFAHDADNFNNIVDGTSFDSLKVDMRHRFHDYSDSKIKRIKNYQLQNNQCLDCFMHQEYCICSKVKNIFSRKKASIQTHVSVFMHCCEYGKPSNTGKLLRIGLSGNSSNGNEELNRISYPIYGNKEGEDKLLALFKEMPSLILYPGPSSQPIKSVLANLLSGDSMGTSDQQQQSIPQTRKIHICALDATWNLSKSMQRLLPKDVPRVNVDELVKAPSLFLNRKQISETQVSTIEALALALECIGEDQEALNPLYESLKVSVDAVLLQAGRKAAYGNAFP